MITAKNRRVALFVRGVLNSGSCSEAILARLFRRKLMELSSTCSTRPKRTNLSRFPVIIYACLMFRFRQEKAPSAEQVSGN